MFSFQIMRCRIVRSNALVFFVVFFSIGMRNYGADGFIISVLQRKDNIFASTNNGLYRASLSDKTWHKLPTPSGLPFCFASDGMT
jgi:hypothetical protein